MATIISEMIAILSEIPPVPTNDKIEKVIDNLILIQVISNAKDWKALMFVLQQEESSITISLFDNIGIRNHDKVILLQNKWKEFLKQVVEQH